MKPTTMWPSVQRGETPPTSDVVPEDGATLDSVPVRFVWESQREADSYRIVLFDLESTPLWTNDRVTERSVEVPEEVRAMLLPGRAYYWRVVSRTGVESSESPLYRFKLGQ